MPLFSYKASDRSGKVKKDTLSAASKSEVSQSLRRQGLTPLEISETTEKKKSSFFNFSKLQLTTGKKVKPFDVTVFFRQISITIKAGVSLTESLNNIAKEMDKSALRTALLNIEQDLQGGSHLAEAMERHNGANLFPPVAIGLSRVAEETGTLDETLNELADHMEASQKMKGDIKSKLSYPTFMIVAFIGCMLICTFKLFPMFQENFDSLGAELPELTQRVFAANQVALVIAPYGLGLLFLIVAGLAFFRSRPAGRRTFDRNLLKIPLIGDLIHKIQTARFCHTLGITTNGGVPLLEGLRISTDVLDNASMKYRMEEIRERVTSGNPLGKSCRAVGVFSGLVVRMIEVGEQSGDLPLVLNKVSEIYNLEIDQTITKITALIEPVIIVVFGVFVTVMVLALYMPIFSVSGG